MSKILHGGRISGMREDVAAFTSSIKNDLCLFNPVVELNKAHVIMLIEQKIISKSEGAALLESLNNLTPVILEGASEDVHMAVEEKILEQTGPNVGGNLHIAKSRNDQVTTAIRMHLRNELLFLMRTLSHVQSHIIEVAKDNVYTVILEYTHLQPAQPVTFAHYLLSFYDSFSRDLERICALYGRVNCSPLGAGALATTSFNINRERTADLLGFEQVLENSVDAVGSRDFILETIFACNMVGVTLSRLSEDLIIWSSPEFGNVELPDEFTSTSSIMPQKKNPEVLEIIRSRTSWLLGNLVSVTCAVKNLPTTYNLDFQELTPTLWESITLIVKSLDMVHKFLPKVKITGDVAGKSSINFVAATELANLLVKKYDIPFRLAHKIVGIIVKKQVELKKGFKDITPELVEKIVNQIVGIKISINANDIASLNHPLKLVEFCSVLGGPAPNEVKRALKSREKTLLTTKFHISKLDEKIEDAKKTLDSTVSSYVELGKNKNFKNKK